MNILISILIETWSTLAEMAPYLLFGFFVAGLLSVFISPELVEQQLGGRGLWPVLKAALFGIPLPLCSCGVIPVGASLRRHGASRGASTSFLISTPQTGVDSLLVTYSLLGPIFAIVRPIAALVSGLLGGIAVTLLGEDGQDADANNESGSNCTEACCVNTPQRSRMIRALHYGFVTLPQDLARALLLGLLAAGLIAALVPEKLFADYLGGGFGAMVLMLVIGIPIYVCATGSVPIAAALLLKGISPGAVLVFLMTGPATNAAAFATIWKVLGRRTAIIYVSTVAVTALLSGALLDLVVSSADPASTHAGHVMIPAWLENLSALVLLGVLGYALIRRYRGAGTNSTALGEGGATMSDTIHLSVSGMNCNHCVNSITRALGEMSGVETVNVNLADASAVVTGTQLDIEAICAKVKELGFEASRA